jgi:hypothetical protein
VGTIHWHTLVPILASDEERQAALDEFAEIHWALRDQGCDVTVGVECSAEGDRYVLIIEEPPSVAV